MTRQRRNKLEKKYSLPLDMRDMLKQQLDFEDKLLPYGERITHIKVEMSEPLPPVYVSNNMRKWSPTALFVFGRNIIRREFNRAMP